jgi:hypothetical protein
VIEDIDFTEDEKTKTKFSFKIEPGKKFSASIEEITEPLPEA